MNESEESYNYKKKTLKFEIQLKEEERELGQLENVDSEEGEKINLDDIGLEKQNIFGGSNLNAALAL